MKLVPFRLWVNSIVQLKYFCLEKSVDQVKTVVHEKPTGEGTCVI